MFFIDSNGMTHGVCFSFCPYHAMSGDIKTNFENMAVDVMKVRHPSAVLADLVFTDRGSFMASDVTFEIAITYAGT